jgi:hypothetical protein
MNLDSEIIDLFFSSSKYGTYWFLHVADLTCNVYMYFTGMLFYCIDLYARKHGDYWWSSSWFIIPTGTHYIEWKYILELVLLLNVFVRVIKTCIGSCSLKHFFLHFLYLVQIHFIFREKVLCTSIFFKFCNVKQVIIRITQRKNLTNGIKAMASKILSVSSFVVSVKQFTCQLLRTALHRSMVMAQKI